MNQRRFFSTATLNNQSGMTLVEILIVLTIIAAMATYLVPRLFGAGDKAKIKETQIKIGQLSQSLQSYYNDCGKYPSALGGLMEKDECVSWGPKYANKVDLVDGWKRDFVYETQGQTFKITSYGKDGQEGGEGENADITSDDQ